MKGQLVRKAMVTALSMFLIFSSFHAAFAKTEMKAEAPADLKASWASKALQEWWTKEWIHGYPDGTFRPDSNITRAEFMTLVNQVLGLSAKAGLSFRDLSIDNWAYDQIAIAVKAGYVKGYEDRTIRPDSSVSREEVSYMVNALLQPDEGKRDVSRFKDAADFAGWSKAAIGSLAAEGILSGYPDGTFRPENKITRAEAVVVLNNAMQFATKTRADIYNKAGVYGALSGVPSIVGSVTVNASGVTLQNMVILGDLTVDGAEASGTITLQNVIVRGETHINGGVNQASVVDSTLESLQVCMKNGSVRITAEGRTVIHRTSLCSSAFLEEKQLTGEGFIDALLSKEIAAGSSAELRGDFNAVNVDGAGVKLLIEQGTIRTVTFGKDSGGSTGTVGNDSTIEHLVLDAVVSMNGQGAIETATLNQGAEGSGFERKPEQIDGPKAGSAVIKPVDGGGTTPGGEVPAPTPPGDTAPPIFLAAYPQWTAVSETSAQVISKMNEQGQLYAVAVLRNDPAPTSAQVKSGLNSGGSNALSYAQSFAAANAETVLQLNDLTAGTDYDIYAAAADSNGNVQTMPVKGSVKTNGIAPLTFVTASLPNGKAGTAYAITLESSGGVGARAYSLVSGALPIGTAFSSAGVFSGTPSVAGTYTFTLRVTDSRPASAEQSFTLTVEPPEPITFVTTSLPNGKAGTPYAVTLESSGGIGTRYYSLTSGGLPIGTAFSSAGVFSGTPSVAGTYTITFRVTDSQPASASQTFTIVIEPPEPITFVTTSLPNGKAGTPYAVTLESSGGIGTRYYSLTSGGLPIGTAFSSAGVFSGTPSVAGTYTFTLRVTDSQPASASQSFTIVIAP